MALALGFEGTAVEIAARCQRAEQAATGVPCGILDQLAVGGRGRRPRPRHGLHTISSLTPVPVPDDLEIVVVHSGQARTLAGSAYAERRAECEAAEAIVGPLRSARSATSRRIDDAVLRRRARHVVTENHGCATLPTASPPATLVASASSSPPATDRFDDDFEGSTPTVDATVDRLGATPGVCGARMTGGGWGGCVVAVTEPWRARRGLDRAAGRTPARRLAIRS